MSTLHVIDTDNNSTPTPVGGVGDAMKVVVVSGDTGTGGGGDASAANQTTQISLETEIRDRLPATPYDQPITDTQLRATKVPVASSGFAANPSASFTRPADTTAYAIGDLIANSTTAGSVVPMQFTVAREAAGSFMIRRLKFSTSNASGLNAQKRVHLFTTLPVPVNGDNGAFSSTGAAGYIGAFDVTLDRAFTDGAVGFGVPLTGSDMVVKLASGQIIYGLLEARSANTPASGSTITVTLETLQN